MFETNKTVWYRTPPTPGQPIWLRAHEDDPTADLLVYTGRGEWLPEFLWCPASNMFGPAAPLNAIEPAPPKFEIGQMVECVTPGGGNRLTKGRLYEVQRVTVTDVYVYDDYGGLLGFYRWRFKAVKPTINPDEWHPLLARYMQGTFRSHGTVAGTVAAAEVLTMWCLTNMATQLLAARAAPVESDNPAPADLVPFSVVMDAISGTRLPVDSEYGSAFMEAVAWARTNVGAAVARWRLAAVEGMESGGERP